MIEKPECTQARDSVKQFYSLYLGSDLNAHPDDVQKFLKYLAPTFSSEAPEDNIDPYTLSREMPKTFRLGKCDAPQPERANIQVQVFWRDDTKTVQKEVHVEAVKLGDTWLINRVSN